MSTGLQEDSPLTQDQQIEEFVQASSLPPWTRTYFDLAESAGSTERRPGILQLIADAETLRPAVIVFYKLDRAFRNSTEQGIALRRLKKAGVKVLKVRDPNIEGPQGDLIDTVLGAVNQFEREITGVRIRDHNLAMAQRGEWPGGRVPYGYRYEKAQKVTQGGRHTTVEPGHLVPDPVERPIARQIWEWALAGYRKAEIVDMANTAGYRRRGGGAWTPERINAMLINKTYAGYVPFAREIHMDGKAKYRWDRAEWYPGHHEPIVTLEEWLQVQATTNTRMGQRRPSPRPRAELAGLIRCAACQGPVCVSSRSSSGDYRYSCMTADRRAAGHPYWSRSGWLVHTALQAILDAVAHHLPPSPPPAASDTQRRASERKIASLRTQMERLRTLFRVGEYNDDLDAYLRDKRDLEVKLALEEAQMAQSGHGADAMAQRWTVLRNWEALYLRAGDSVRERQLFWAAVIERVETDGTILRATLRDFGPAVSRVWEVSLPKAARQPGTRSGRGVVGVVQREGRQSNALLLRGKSTPRAVEPV